MIIIKIYGGLGNQMFQYAIGKSLSIKHKTKLKLDLSWFSEVRFDATATPRYFELDAFNVSYELATEIECEKFAKSSRNSIFQRLSNILTRTSFYKEYTYIGYNPAIERSRLNSYLDGYFQNERYFHNIEGLLRKDFTFKTSIAKPYHEFERMIETSESVAVHIRRGDYLKLRELDKSFHVCDMSYYIDAMDYITNILKTVSFFIFSDDMLWCKKNLNRDNVVFVEPTGESSHLNEFELMKSCKHQIISNSTFSWWAAYLNSNVDKTIISPKLWYRSDSSDENRSLENWILI